MNSAKIKKKNCYFRKYSSLILFYETLCIEYLLSIMDYTFFINRILLGKNET